MEYQGFKSQALDFNIYSDGSDGVSVSSVTQQYALAPEGKDASGQPEPKKTVVIDNIKWTLDWEWLASPPAYIDYPNGVNDAGNVALITSKGKNVYWERQVTYYSDNDEPNYGAPTKSTMLDVDFINALGITAKKITVLDKSDDDKLLFEADGISGDGSVKIANFTVKNGKLYSGDHEDIDSTDPGIYLGSEGLSIGNGFKVSSGGVPTVAGYTKSVEKKYCIVEFDVVPASEPSWWGDWDSAETKWTDTPPNRENGKYIWEWTKTTRTTTRTDDANPDITKNIKVCITGAKGEPGESIQGRSVLSVTKFYKLATSVPNKPTEKDPTDWYVSPPAFSEGNKYYESDRTIYDSEVDGKDYSWSDVIENSMLTVDFIDSLGITAKKITVLQDNTAAWNSTTNPILFEADGISGDGKVKIANFTVENNKIYSNNKSSLTADVASNEVNGVYIGTDGIALGKGNFVVTDTGNVTIKGYVTSILKKYKRIKYDNETEAADHDLGWEIWNTWWDDIPDREDGLYIWEWTQEKLGDGTLVDKGRVCITGATGEQGISVKAVTPQYALTREIAKDKFEYYPYPNNGTTWTSLNIAQGATIESTLVNVSNAWWEGADFDTLLTEYWSKNNSYPNALWTREKTEYDDENKPATYSDPIKDTGGSAIGKWCSENDRTLINGAHIATGTIDAYSINTEHLGTQIVKTGVLSANNIVVSGSGDSAVTLDDSLNSLAGVNLAASKYVLPYKDITMEVNDYVYKLTTTQQNDGLKLDSALFKPNTNYVVSYKFKIISGAEATAISGHSAGFTINKAIVDGKDQGNISYMTQGYKLEPSTNGVEHSVILYLTRTVASVVDPSLYIQPQRIPSTDGNYKCTMEVWDLQVREGVRLVAWEPPYEDTQASIQEALDKIQVSVENLATPATTTVFPTGEEPNNGVYTIYTTQFQHGIILDTSIFELDKSYVLSFKLKDLYDSLPTELADARKHITKIGGHCSAFTTTSATIDGKTFTKGSYDEGYSLDPTKTIHTVVVVLTKVNTDNDANLYIQPSRNYPSDTLGEFVTLSEIWDLVVAEGEGSEMPTSWITYQYATTESTTESQGKPDNNTIWEDTFPSSWSSEEVKNKVVWRRTKTTSSNNSNITYSTPELLSTAMAATLAAKSAGTSLGAWCQENNVTIIDGANLMTGKITAQAMKVDTLSTIASNMGTLKAGRIQSAVGYNTQIIPASWNITPEGSSGLKYKSVTIDENDGLLLTRIPGYEVVSIGSSPDTDIIIPGFYNKSPVLQIADNAFKGSSITSIEIPDTVREIKPYAFDGCTSLKTVQIPDTLEVLGGRVFQGCTSLSTANHGGVRYIGNDNNKYLIALSAVDMSITEVDIHPSCKFIHSKAFSNCQELKSVTLPMGLKGICGNAFDSCVRLESIILPTSLSFMEGYVFQNCTALTHVSIPNSIDKINIYTFNECTNLQSIVLGSGIKTIDYGAFKGCVNLRELYYVGEEADFNTIKFLTKEDGDNENSIIAQVTKYYYRENAPIKPGNQWHYLKPAGFQISTDSDYIIDSAQFKVNYNGTVEADQCKIGNFNFNDNMLKSQAMRGDNGSAMQASVQPNGAQLLLRYQELNSNNQRYLNTAHLTPMGLIMRRFKYFQGSSIGLGETPSQLEITLQYPPPEDFGYKGKNPSEMYNGDTYYAIRTTSGNLYLAATDDGNYGYLDKTWYTASDVLVNSDKNLKHDIEDLPSEYGTLFDQLRPVRYKYNNGESDRYHTGFIAQEVGDAANIANIDLQDFAAVCCRDIDTEHKKWGLRYGEFVALNTDQIQKLKTRVAELETTVEELTKLVNEKLNQA